MPEAENLQDALAVVYEVPLYLDSIQAADVPVFAVLTENMTYEMMLPLLQQGVTIGTKEYLTPVLQKFKRPKPVPTIKFVNKHTIQIANKPLTETIQIAEPEIHPTPRVEPAHIIEPAKEKPVFHEPYREEPVRQPEIVQNKPYDMFSRSISGDRNAHIIASFSTKGGVGKTSLAINLGAVYAARGHKAVLLDLDLGTGNAADIMGIDNDGPTVENWREFARNLAGSIKKHKSGLYILPCGSNDFNMSGEDIEDLIDLLTNSFEYILMDFGTKAFFPHAKKGLELADKIYIMATQEQGMVQTLVSKFLNDHEDWVRSGKTALIVNRVSPLGYYKASEIAKMANFKAWHEIPDDPAGFEAAKRAKTTVVQLKKSLSSQAFLSIAEENGSGISEPKKGKGFFQKFFK